MQIILLERIEKLGTIGDVVTVKDGYARNFLLTQGKALRATAVNRLGARLMGISLPENFRWPYLATGIQDFWQRWHITPLSPVSTWNPCST